MPESGARIGKYRIVAHLGKGGMGEVWRAHDERLGRDVAIKVLRADHADDYDRRARLLREARAAAAIRHVNVVTLFDVFEHEGEDILVMELVEGRTLFDILRDDGRPSLQVGLHWIEAIADALVAAHACGILHRDIKPSNVMITSEGGVKVVDFGLAKLDRADATRASMIAMAPVPADSLDATVPASVDDHAQTRAGSLLGTPQYMAPEQIAGAAPDVHTEVYSVGVVAYEILAGHPPHTGPSVEELFVQITEVPPPALGDVPEPVAVIVRQALEKDPAARFPTMRALRDAIAAERKRRFAPVSRSWPLLVTLLLLAAGSALGVLWWRAQHVKPQSRADAYVDRAIEEYDSFYKDKALSSLRAALRLAPNHPRANAYVILFGDARQDDLYAAMVAGQRARPLTADNSKERALLDTAIAYLQHGPIAAKAALAASGATQDRELGFWAAELDYKSGHYQEAHGAYRALLAQPALAFRGRIYDHDSAVLIYFDEPDEALRVGTLYRDAFPGEADAVDVYATTLAKAGRLDDAVAAAEDAVRLHEGEATLAGLASVLTLRGDRARAKQLYQRALEAAGPYRRPLRRAALAWLQWIDGELDAAKATVAPCIESGHELKPDAEARVRERGACLFVAGIIDPTQSEPIARQLDQLAAGATDAQPAYGTPTSLAQLVRARAHFFGGGCVVDPQRADVATPIGDISPGAYDVPLDFQAAYHLPYFFAWATCEQAALIAARGDRQGAAARLRSIATRAPNRRWLLELVARYSR